MRICSQIIYNKNKLFQSTQNDTNTAIAEVLDLTHDQHSPFKLEFDDHEWKTHLSSLKPLGKRNNFSMNN